MEGVGRIPAPHDDQLGVREGVVLIAVHRGTEGPEGAGGRTLVRGDRPGAGAAPEHPQESGQQTLDLIGFVQNAVGGAGVALVEQGRGAVFVLDVDHLVGDVVQRLVPADALELALAPFTDPSHRVEQPFGRVKPLPIGPSAQTAAQLGLCLRVLAELAVLLVSPVVRGQAHDHVTLLVGDQHMPGAAVMGAAGDDRLQVVVPRIRLIGKSLGVLRLDQSARTDGRRASRGRLQKRPPRDIQTGVEKREIFLLFHQ